MSKVRRVQQLTYNQHLNLYELEAEKRDGSSFPYYSASRSKTADSLKLSNGSTRPDGVTIYALTGEQDERVVLIRQYRYPAGRYLYEFPAGLVEKGEDYREAAIREVREETGLELTPLQVDPLFEKAYFSSAGMTDESCCMVYGRCRGTVSTEGLEDTEDVSVVLADRAMVREILMNHEAAMSAAYHLMHFLSDDKPFAFLQQTAETKMRQAGRSAV